MPSSARNKTRDFRDIPPPQRDSDVLRAAIFALGERLPSSWTLRSRKQRSSASNHSADLVAYLTSPDGDQITLLFEAKRLITPRDVQPIISQLDTEAAAQPLQSPVVPVLAARYLPETTRRRITEAGAGYIDATGNVRITANRPALFLSDRGADRDPWRGPGRPRSGLHGEPAAKVVRALVDFAPPYSVPALAKHAGSSTGATYRVVEFLEQEELIARTSYGPITAVRWRDLLMRWSEDYGLTSNPVSLFTEPRGLGTFLDRLRAAEDLKYVVTGSLAAERVAPFAPPRQAIVYADNPEGFVAATGLRGTRVGGNVAVATPLYDVVFDRSEIVSGVSMAAPSQVVVDLLTGSGRNPSEAVALLDWMEANERAWRS